MTNTSSIAVIGLGYWGTIILNNLREMGYKNIQTYDEFLHGTVDSLEKIDADYIFVCVPTAKHFKICKYFLSWDVNKRIFCEKPLTGNVKDSEELFKMAKKNSCRLFVDWLFTYNNEVNYIQKYYFDDKKLGEPLNINMNRLNKGPARTDTNAIQDLASHDISILEYWFRQPASSVNWISYKRNKQSLKDDSCVGILKFNKTTVQINCSWEHNIKDRTCILGFENGIVQWDDIKKEIIDEEKITLIQSSPVKNAIQAFMSDSYYEYHVIESTLSIERTLDATCFNIR